MPQPPAQSPLSEADFELIASAVNETERGRWFLAEYARRNRHADTQQVLEAIEKLERMVGERGAASHEDSIRLTVADMSEAIARTKAEIAAIKPTEDSLGKIGDATVELDAIVSTTEQATSEILAAAENVQEIAWTLREQGTEASVCDKLDELMTQTYTACSFQDLTGQRIRKIVNVLNFLEARIEAMNLIWGKHDTVALTEEAPHMEAQLLNGPALPGQGLQQFAVDELLDPVPPIPNPPPQAELDALGAESDIVWEDAPVGQETPRSAADAAAKLIAENISVEDIEAIEDVGAAEDIVAVEAEAAAELEITPLAPAVSAPAAAGLRGKSSGASAPAPIESLSAIEKLALFS
jgi:chemotaxis regulatin CheY-phosphate phosphatase CheZ